MPDAPETISIRELAKKYRQQNDREMPGYGI
jgi:hypothetical protein